jgi:glutamine synthetase
VAGVDANPYLVAAVTLGAALDGIAAQADPGPPTQGDANRAPAPGLPRHWDDAVDAFETSDFARRILGDALHRAYTALKRAEIQRLSRDVPAAEWELYGFVV